MAVRDGDFVIPGEYLGIIEQFVPGEGTYEDNGNIKSTVLGNVSIDSKKRQISILPLAGNPAALEVGDTVYCQIDDIRGQRALVNIVKLKDTDRELALPYLGAIHISQAKDGYIDKLTDAFRIGDIIEAEVVKITGDNVDLSTQNDNCGVNKAMCTKCRSFMKTTKKPYELKCPNCGNKEKREISSNYLNI